METEPRRRDSYDVIEFSIEVQGKRVICWISREALEDHFGASGDNHVGVLLANLDRIAPIAEQVYRTTPAGERVLVRTSHF